MKNIIFLCIALLIANPTWAQSLEKLFYLTNDATVAPLLTAEKLQKIKMRSTAIDIIAPQVYQLDETGLISGSIDPYLLTIAEKNHMKVMPLIINTGFNQKTFHDFLHNPNAVQNAVKAMLLLCQTNHLYGLQFDFENINVADKEIFTQFFLTTADTLHQNGFAISIAVVPHIDDTPPQTQYEQWYFDNWSGAYDYQALANASDFITLMAYDRHTSLTTPGPIAPFNWVENVVTTALKIIPAEKISLGIPAYSGDWTIAATDIGNKNPFRSKEAQIGYDQLSLLLQKTNQSLTWDRQTKSYYLIDNHNGFNEYIFAEEAYSFAAKKALAEVYHLRGFSVWQFGMEDPAIWNSL